MQYCIITALERDQYEVLWSRVQLSSSNTHTIYNKKKVKIFQKFQNFQESYVIKQLLQLISMENNHAILYNYCT
jgi:hypothetical protein